ncbi:MAG: hypothetical protein ACK4V6_01970 [Microthrixaceae bacterium]
MDSHPIADQLATATPSDADGVDATGSVGDRSQVEVERHLDRQGFGGQFGAREGANVLCFTCHEEFAADLLDADDARRVEGESDPSDMAIVVPVTCPHCSTAGTLSLQYGPMSSVEEWRHPRCWRPPPKPVFAT